MKTQEFDYIVVGAGSAGCVIANRLSKDPNSRVALVEAGDADTKFPLNLKTLLPFGNIFLLSDKRYNWQYSFDAAPEVGDRAIPCPRGKLLGGCSAINGAVYIRGHRKDYDSWAKKFGVEGWSYNDVLTAFKKQESWSGPHNQFHGEDGELTVSDIRSPNKIATSFIAAGVEAGHEHNEDFNGASQDGVGYYHVNQKKGARMSSARAFLRPAKKRSNLSILHSTMVEKIVIEGKRVTGLLVERDGEKMFLSSAKEVVISAGAINSPQLLMISGIGDKDHLAEHGIETVVNLPGVGQNLQDHPSVGLSIADKSRASMALNPRSAPKMALAGLQYMFTQNGRFSSNAAEAGGYIRTLPDLEKPDAQLTLVVGMKTSADLIPSEHGFVLHVNVCQAKSRGRVYLKSASHKDKPGIEHGFLKNDEDVQTLVRGLKIGREIIAQPALAEIAGEELIPGKQCQSDEELSEAVRQNLATVYHPVGTCRMGTADDPNTVVDSRLKVLGIDGLRVADASVIPEIMAGNTSAPSMMIGERASEFIIEDNQF